HRISRHGRTAASRSGRPRPRPDAPGHLAPGPRRLLGRQPGRGAITGPGQPGAVPAADRARPRTVLASAGLPARGRRSHDAAPRPGAGVPRPPPPPPRAARLHAPLGRPCEVHARHRWPPDFAPPPAGRFVLMQPWEFGSLPRAWAGPIADHVGEVWAYTRAVR